MGKSLFIYGIPGPVGGADTKLDHTLPLFTKMGFDQVMCIANAPSQLENKVWMNYLDSLGVKHGLKEDIKNDNPGDIALSLCNDYFFVDGFCDHAKSKGFEVIWSSEMMWHHKKELEYVNKGMVDKLLYVSEVQKSKLTYPEGIPTYITGNYVDASRFPFKERSVDKFRLGRLSRADSYKYPENFPSFYERIVKNVPAEDVEFHVMGWFTDFNTHLVEKYSWHDFSKYNWYLYKETAIPTLDFLYNIDIYAYPLGHNFIESWGRSTVEAMLTGAIPISFSGHHLENLLRDREIGYIADDVNDWTGIIDLLYNNPTLRKSQSKACSDYAREVICNEEEHIKIWKEVFNV